MPLRLWFNQAYRGTYQQIAMMRVGAAADGLELHVTGSHTVPSTPFLQACDGAFAEPEQITGSAWVQHALQVCRERGIDVFVPGRERLAVAESRDAFEDAGVRVMVSPPDALRVLGDKTLAHASAQALGIAVPATHVVTDAAGFRAAYDDLCGRGLRVCVKPALDHGAAGFRILDETAGGWTDLQALPSARVHPDEVERRLARQGTVASLLVAELLEGAELSVDVLSRAGEVLAAVARSKAGPQWTRQIVDDPAAVGIAETVTKAHRLSYLSNVQVRYGAGSCRLLEVNTRPASGLHHSAAAGVNLPYAALRLLLDGDVRVPPPRFGATVLLYEEALEIALPF